MDQWSSAILGCLLAAAAVTSVTAVTVSVKLAQVEKYYFTFKGVEFVGRFKEKRDGPTTGTQCKNAGLLMINVIRKDQDGGVLKAIPDEGDIAVCLNSQGVLELRPIQASSGSWLHKTGVTVSTGFWEMCGIAGGKPSDLERVELGYAILGSLNALVCRADL